MNETDPLFQEKLGRRGPRRVLALDGGGIRGVITLEVLAEIERQLQEQLRRGSRTSSITTNIFLQATENSVNQTREVLKTLRQPLDVQT